MGELIAGLRVSPYNEMARNELGAVLVELNRSEEAVLQFKKAIELNPKFPDPYNNFAVLLAGKGKFDQAIPLWRNAIRLDPGNGAIHRLFAEALRMNGDLPDALVQYRAAYNAGERKLDMEPGI